MDPVITAIFRIRHQFSLLINSFAFVMQKQSKAGIIEAQAEASVPIK